VGRTIDNSVQFEVFDFICKKEPEIQNDLPIIIQVELLLI